MSDEDAVLDAMLAAGGLEVGAEDRAVLRASYVKLKQRIDLLWELPEARYETPSLALDVAPKPTSWEDERPSH